MQANSIEKTIRTLLSPKAPEVQCNRDRVAQGRRKLGALFDHLTAPAATPRSGK